VTHKFSKTLIYLASFGCILGGLISGCASYTATGQAATGLDKEPLSHLVLAGQIEVNAYMPVGYANYGYTPLCALVNGAAPVNIRAVDYLLDHGANVNKSCTNENNGLDRYPLDIIVNSLTSVPAEQTRYYSESVVNKSNSLLPFLWSAATKLMKKGAKTYDGRATMPEVEEAVGRVNTFWVNDINAERERLAAERAAKKDSFFNAENLSTLVGIAGVAVNNYAAAKGTPSPNLSLPVIATSQRQVQEKQPSGTFSSTRTGNIETAKRGGADSTKIAEAPTAAQRAPTLAIYKFQSSISFRSPKMSEEKARKWVADDRARMNSPQGIHISYTVNMETPITCHEVDHNVTHPKSICEMTVTWDVVSHENPNMDLKKMPPAQAIQK